MPKATHSVTMAPTLAAIVLLFCLVEWLPAQTHDHWPQFRGPEARGVADGPNLPDRWSDTENIAWKTDLPGRAWSSPIVWAESVFLTTAVNSGQLESPKKGLYFGGNRPEPREVQLEYKVLCLDLPSGTIRWEKTVHQGPSSSPIHLKNSFASETPVTDGERVYAYFGNQGLYCLDLEGNLVWSKPFEPRPTRNGWGTGASPVLHGDRIYLVNDNEQESFLIALDKKTGEPVWRVQRDEKSNWSTPFVWTNELRTEIVTPGTDKTRSYGLDGKLLWEFGGMSSHTIPTPFAAHGLLFVTSGYINTLIRPLFAVRPGAAGDITLPDDQPASQFIAWCQRKAGPYNPSPIVYGDYLYVLYDRGTIACYHARTGDEAFGQRRIGSAGSGFTSSPWAYGGKIFCQNEDGVTFVLRAGPEFELLHTNELADDDMCMATPAIVGDRLLIRTSARVYCIHQPGATIPGESREPTLLLSHPAASDLAPGDPPNLRRRRPR
ncbi:MAG: outer membrane protein assembly factor BamB family protein [Thermoguttaceae bacterium]